MGFLVDELDSPASYTDGKSHDMKNIKKYGCSKAGLGKLICKPRPAAQSRPGSCRMVSGQVMWSPDLRSNSQLYLQYAVRNSKCIPNNCIWRTMLRLH